MEATVLTEALAQRVEQVAVAWSRAWMNGIAGIELGDFAPHVLAPCHPERPELDFQNRVNGLTPNDAGLVALIAGWYAERGVRPWFEIVPSDDGGDLLDALVAVGAAPIGFHAMVTGTLPRVAPPSPPPAVHDDDVEVVVVDPADDDLFTTFRRVRLRGHDLPPEVVEEAVADLAGWATAAGAHLYLAFVAGEPAATAALTVDGQGVGYLADGATLPAFRGRGLQSLLIERRLDDAAALGCTIACSQASFASTSHRNLQRAGLSAGFTKLVVRVASP